MWSARAKSLEILRRGCELNPDHREDRQWAIPLSYHDWFTFYADKIIKTKVVFSKCSMAENSRDIYRWLRTGWQLKDSLDIDYHGWALIPSHGENRQWNTFILPLSYHVPSQGEDRQWDTFILPLSYHDRPISFVWQGKGWQTSINMPYDSPYVWKLLRGHLSISIYGLNVSLPVHAKPWLSMHAHLNCQTHQFSYRVPNNNR